MPERSAVHNFSRVKYSKLATAAGLLALTAFALWYGTHSPAPEPASAPASDFSAERAMVLLAQIAQRPHPSGSADHARVRNYLVTQLAAMGIPAQIQTTTGVSTRYAVAGRVHNVVARIPGTNPGGAAVLLMSHYDGVGAGPAAADAGAGTVALLETARALKAGAPLAHDVILLWTDSEESGLHGAAAFAREHPWARDAAVILNFEARGVNGASRMFETGAGNLDAVRVLRRVPSVRASSLSVTVYRMLPNDTDLSEMVVLDRPMMNFAWISGVQRYHTSQDDTTHLSRASLQHHGTYALYLAREFANGPLPRPASGDAAFFDFPVVGLVFYPVGWSLPLALVAAAVVLAAIVMTARTRPDSWKDMLRGALGLFVSTLLAGAACVGMAWVIARVHANPSIGGAPQWSAVYTSALALLCVAVNTAVWMFLRRRAAARDAHLGALALLTIATLAMAAALPGVSFLLLWPLLFAAVAAVLWRRATTRRIARTATVAEWIAAGVTLIFFAPTIYAMVAVALGLDLVGATLLAVLSGIAIWLIMPLLDALAAPGFWNIALVSAEAAALLLGFGMATVRSGARHPAGGSFVYAIDADSMTTWLAGTATTPAARAWMQFALQPDAAAQTPPPGWLTRTFDRRRVRFVGPGTATPPSVLLLGDSVAADSSRVVTLRIRPDPGALSIATSVEGGTVLAASVDGRAIDRSRYRSRSARWLLDYVAPTDSGFVLRLAFAKGSLPLLGITSRRAGIPPLAGYRPPTKPDWLLPYHSGDMTVVYRRIRF